MCAVDRWTGVCEIQARKECWFKNPFWGFLSRVNVNFNMLQKHMRTKLWKFCLITDIMNANTVCLEYWSWIVISKGVAGLALISVTWSEQHWYTILGLAPREKKLNLKLIGYSLSELAYICWNASVTLGLQKWIDVWLKVTWN